MLARCRSFNDRVQQLLFRPNHLAPTFSEKSQVRKPPRYNAYYDMKDIAPVDGATWKLELAGQIKDKRSGRRTRKFTHSPSRSGSIRHICVEGWDYIGQWSGVNLRQFLERIGAGSHRQICLVQVRRRLSRRDRHGDCAAPADHPGDEIRQRADTDPVRLPAGLRTATKLGFKNPKWITAIEVINDLSRRILGDRGFNWFAGSSA